MPGPDSTTTALDAAGTSPFRHQGLGSNTEKAVEEAKLKPAELEKKLQDEKEELARKAAEDESKEQWELFLKYIEYEENAHKAILMTKLGIENMKDLRDIGVDPDPNMFFTAGFTLAMARRVATISEYAFEGGTISSDSATNSMVNYVRKKNDGTNTTNTPKVDASSEKEPEEHLRKAEIDIIDPFDNDPAEFEEHWEEVVNTLGPTRSGIYLTKKADPSKTIQVTSSRTLYYILNKAFSKCTVKADIQKVYDKHGTDGYETAKAITSYYRSADIVSRVKSQWRNKLEALKIEGDPDSFAPIGDYLSNWQLCHKKLNKAGETWDDDRKRDAFLKGIMLKDSNPIQQTKISFAREIDALTFDKALKDIDTVARQSFQLDDGEQTSKARRNQTSNKNSNDEGDDTVKRTDVRFPKYVLTKIRRECADHTIANAVIGTVLRWRKVFVEERRQPTPEEMDKPSGKKRDASQTSTSDAGGKTKRKKTRRNRSKGDGKRVQFQDDSTRTRQTKTDTEEQPTKKKDADSTVKVLIKDTEIEKAIAEDDSGSESDDSQSNNDDSHSPSESNSSKESSNGDSIPTRKTKTSSCGRLIKESDGSYRQIQQLGSTTRRSSADVHHLIVDSGTECEIVGGNGWRMIEAIPSRSERIHGYFNNSESQNLQYASATTVYDHPEKGPMLFGVTSIPFDPDRRQDESVLNPNFFGLFVNVDERSKQRGGRQSMQVDGADIPLLMHPEKLVPYIQVRPPTDKELHELDIIWLVPPGNERGTAKDTTPSQTITRRNPLTEQPEKAKWTERLANCPQKAADKTLEATTQYCDDDVAAESREIPRRQMQKRLHPLHNRRLPGRTDTDTVFAPKDVKSVRGYSCFQLFVHLLSSFIYVRLMKREKESHPAYQDFIRDVGIPNHIHSDNAQTETGEKWSRTSRQNQTRQSQSIHIN